MQARPRKIARMIIAAVFFGDDMFQVKHKQR